MGSIAVDIIDGLDCDLFRRTKAFTFSSFAPPPPIFASRQHDHRCDRPLRERFFDLLVDRGVSVDALGACRGLRSPEIPLLRRGRASPSWHDDAVEAYENYRLVSER